MGNDQESPASETDSSLSATEYAVAALWGEVIEMSQLPSATDNFFGLGGDSIAMITVLFRIREELAVDLPEDAIFTAPSLRGLSALIDAASQPRDSSTPASEPQAYLYAVSETPT